MRTSSPKLETSHLTMNESALLKCQTALELKDQGNYEGARKVMGSLWDRVGEHPQTNGLYPSVAAEVLLCVGILTGWIGGKDESRDAQEAAKNLITESITFY